MNQKSLRLQIHHEEPKHTPNVSEQMYQSSISELSNDEGIEKDEDDEEKTEEKESDSTTGLLCVRVSHLVSLGFLCQNMFNIIKFTISIFCYNLKFSSFLATKIF